MEIRGLTAPARLVSRNSGVNSLGWRLSATIEHVIDGKNGVLEDHPRAGVTHHRFDAGPHR